MPPANNKPCFYCFYLGRFSYFWACDGDNIKNDLIEELICLKLKPTAIYDIGLFQIRAVRKIQF